DGTAETKAIDLPSGDQASRSPSCGSGLFDVITSASGVTPVPSALPASTPLPPFAVGPMKAMRVPSFDHRAFDPSAAPGHRVARPLARSAIQICDHGAPIRSLLMTVNAACEPSGDSWTSVTERR